MAEPIQSGAVSTGEVKTLEQRAVSRLAACRTWKSYIELDLKECYFFSAPNRQRQISSQVMPSQSRMLDAPELNTDEAFIICQDFVTEIVNAFMPEAEKWCERSKGMDISQDAWNRVKDQIAKDDVTIFDAIKASNLYPEITKAFYPDLPIGTVGLWIDRPHPAAPITCSAIPLRELEIDLGPYGEIDTRFAVRYTRNHYVRELVGEEIWGKMDPELKKAHDDKPSERTQVVWGFWRDWADKSDEVWQSVVLLTNTLIHDKMLKGEGSCPLVVTRFNPTADWPHGLGPLIQGLPSFRQIDELELMRSENASLSIKPPITYPDDSFAQVEHGVEEGMAYPIRPGSEGAVKNIYNPPPPNAANFQYQEKLKKLRKLFFVDYPEQTGDTPPTLGQWLDEMARAQRRIGTPGLPFWREGPMAYFLRYKHLLEVAGKIQPVRVDGRVVSAMPRNPAQAAAEQQEVGMAQKAIGLLGQAFPEEFKMYIDGAKTMKNILEKMRVKLLAFRDPKQVAEVTKQMAQLAGARHVPGAPDQPAGPAG
jgi:Bacteriophage head to tail connecting protein